MGRRKSRDDSLKQKSDSDNIGPCSRYILKKAQEIQEKQDRLWTILDFTDKYAAGTIRNNLTMLRKEGLIKTEVRGFLAYYKLTGTKPTKKVTVTPIGGGVGVREWVVDFVGFVESLPWDDGAVHDVGLKFVVDGLYEVVPWPTNDYSKDRASPPIIKSGFTCRVTCHRTGTVTVLVKCANRPFIVSYEGLASLSSVLGEVRSELLRFAEEKEVVIPVVPDWVVYTWHYGKDTKGVVKGRPFEVSFKTWCGTLGRIYLRKTQQIRGEQLESPQKPLHAVFAQRDPATYIHALMNRLGKAIEKFDHSIDKHLALVDDLREESRQRQVVLDRMLEVLSHSNRRPAWRRHQIE